ncbi:MAG: PfkB family carbohydrate kinase [Sphaerochaetaceae bacterium]|nr:PfkB family carbohydrate kinase [Sphaerochaetaceae bacterium]
MNREDELRKAFVEIAQLSDFLIGNEEDFQLALGIKGPEVEGNDLSNNINKFKDMINKVKETYPHVKVFATTLRQVENANEHYWGAIMNVENTWYIEEPRKIQVLDRIGGGDGFVGGILYSSLKNLNQEDWIKFGWATGALATTMISDYATVESEDQIWSIYNGNARIKR